MILQRPEKYYYQVYGLVINSDILLPELLFSNDNEYDIQISYGKMPKYISQEIEKGNIFKFEKDKMWFLIQNTSKYHIYNGNTIIVEPYNNTNNHDVKVFLLGSAFGMLLIQRNIIAIHGGTVVVNGQAIIITGVQGAGKSTLTAGFREKGYRFMADDVSVISTEKNISMVYPGYPQQKLCGDVIKKMGHEAVSFKRIDEGRDKYAIPVYSSFIKLPMPLGAICEITITDSSNVEIKEITGTDKLKLLLKNIYRVEVTHYSGMRTEYFKKCLEIAKNIPVFRIKRPKDKFSIEEQISVIEKTLRERLVESAI